MSKIVIIGGTHHNTLSMIRSLGVKGIKPDVILCGSDNNSYVLTSKYINKKYIARNASEALKIVESEYDNPVIIACSDDIAEALKANVAKYMDKQQQVWLAEKVGFKTPISSIHIVDNDVLTFNHFPCIVKPVNSVDGGKRFSVCHDETELHQVLSTYATGDRVQIQQYIEKDYEIVVDGVSIEGKTIIPGFIKKHRDILGGTSFSSTMPISKLPDAVRRSIDDMILVIGYDGLFGVELIVSEGIYFFVEINLRNDATTYSFVKAGVNLPYNYMKAATWNKIIKHNKLKIVYLKQNLNLYKGILHILFDSNLHFIAVLEKT